MAPDKDDEQGTSPPPIKRTGDLSLNRTEEQRSMREEKATPWFSPPEAPPLQEVNWLIISIITYLISCFILALIGFITYNILRDVGIL